MTSSHRSDIRKKPQLDEQKHWHQCRASAPAGSQLGAAVTKDSDTSNASTES
jgi:hypothetical protein